MDKNIDMENSTGSNVSDTANKSCGFSASNYGTVNKIFDEEKFHARQGHGFSAERAGDLFDRLSGHDAEIVGDNNLKNGADRIVDGIQIQSKYCANGSVCINSCFEDNGSGTFRYMTSDGKPMQIEVPCDEKIYESAVKSMENKIRNGQVKGVSDPAEARKIVRKGHFTYNQAKNIAKAGTVESITYDAVNGAIIASSALGISAMITLAISIWNGEDLDIALKSATYSGLKVGGTAFITSILASQLSRLGLNSVMVSSSEAMAKALGSKTSSMLANAFRGDSKIYGAAATRSAAKLLRGNAITSAVTFALLSSVDVANITQGKISGKQLTKNISKTGSSLFGGAAGSMAAGAAVGSVFPGIGTVVGMLAGALAGGIFGEKMAGKALSSIADDSEVMVKIIEIIFEELANEYFLTETEVNKVLEKLGNKLNAKLLKDMYASSYRGEFAKKLLIPFIEEETSKRAKISVPDNEKIYDTLKTILDDIADEADKISDEAKHSKDIIENEADLYSGMAESAYQKLVESISSKQ